VTSIDQLLVAAARSAGSRPAVTSVDAATGEATELSWASFENWTAKTANLLLEEAGVGAGARVSVDLGRHWSAAVAAAAACRLDAVVVGPGEAADVRFVDEAAAATAPTGGLVVVVGRGFGGRVMGPVPAGAIAFGDEVLAYPDAVAEPGRTRLPDDAAALAAHLNGRVLVDRPPVDVAGLLAPLVAGAWMVLDRAGGVDPALLSSQRVEGLLLDAAGVAALPGTLPATVREVVAPSFVPRDLALPAWRRLGIPVRSGLAVDGRTVAMVPAAADAAALDWLSSTAASTVGVALEGVDLTAGTTDGDLAPLLLDGVDTGSEAFSQTGPDGQRWLFVPA